MGGGIAIFPQTTVVVPTLNEAAHIQLTLERILSAAPAWLVEIIVADGGSSDGTSEIVLDIGAKDTRVKLINNPSRIQSAGINAAVREADPKSEVIVRMDAHSGYEHSFVYDVVSELVRRRADSVVVRLRTVGKSCFAKGVAAVSNSLAGTGGSRHRMGDTSGYVEHGHHAAINRLLFEQLGGYDESFAANEDAELDHRISISGGKIWLAANIVIDYYPRSSPVSLGKQYFRYGSGRAQNFLKHRSGLRLRQMLPLVLVVYLISLPVMHVSLATPFFAIVYGPLVLYSVFLIWSVGNAYRQNKTSCSFASAFALPIMHCAWGFGFLTRLIFRRCGWFSNFTLRI